MPKNGLLAIVSSITLSAFALPAVAADTTSQALLNASKDPQNWLMIHRDYDNSRHKVFDTYFIPTLSVGYSW